MHKALKQNSSVFSRYYLNEDFNEIKFDFELVDDIIVGENFRFGFCFNVDRCSAKRESDEQYAPTRTVTTAVNLL